MSLISDEPAPRSDMHRQLQIDQVSEQDAGCSTMPEVGQTTF